MQPDKNDLVRFEEYILRSVEEWKQRKKPDIVEAFGAYFKLNTKEKENGNRIS
jgi:hypothetical protein